MKKLYTFELFKEELVEKEDSVTDEKTGNITITKKKEKGKIKKEFCIIKPNRQLYDDAELYYNKKCSEAIRAGIMPFALLTKRIDEDGGLLGKKEEEEYQKTINEIIEKQKESLKTNSEKKKQSLQKSIDELKLKLRKIQDIQNSIYNTTAEGVARNKVIFWWILNLAHFIDGEEIKPLFGLGDFQKKLEKFDTIQESEDTFLKEVINNFTYYITLWYVGSPATEEDFKKLIELVNEEGPIEQSEKQSDN